MPCPFTALGTLFISPQGRFKPLHGIPKKRLPAGWNARHPFVFERSVPPEIPLEVLRDPFPVPNGKSDWLAGFTGRLDPQGVEHHGQLAVVLQGDGIFVQFQVGGRDQGIYHKTLEVQAAAPDALAIALDPQ
ncbi:MAG TPA: hypothetical protein DCS43_14635 [Verrucomicrobia bacterium]|nr:hypothetical protein [Verrucomicrobiota bacterium]